MGVTIGGMFGAGLFCIWWSCWPQPQNPSRARYLADRARDVVQQAGLESVSLGAIAACCAGLALITFLVMFMLSQVPMIAVSFALMAGWSPIALIRGRAGRRRERRRDLWPEVVDNLTSGVRAGLSLPEALGQVGIRGPEPLRPYFQEFARDYGSTGSFSDALDRLKERLADPIADRLCEALRITRDVGGSDLGRLLRSLSQFLREDARARSELEARQSWTVYAARLAAAAPWAILALLATRPESVAAYRRPAGTAVLLIGAGCCVVAYRLMVKIARLPEERRVLK